jgi:hypothetical protein
MAGAGLPDGFHQAATEVFRRVPHAGSTAAPADDIVNAVLAALIGDSPPD